MRVMKPCSDCHDGGPDRVVRRFVLCAGLGQGACWRRVRGTASLSPFRKPNGRKLQVWVVYPQVKTKAPVVVMIHEIFGLSDWAEEMADELAGLAISW